MKVECPKCKREYKVRDSEIPAGGGPVQCPGCSNVFTIYREPLDIELVPVEEKEEVKSGSDEGLSLTEISEEKQTEEKVEEAAGSESGLELEEMKEEKEEEVTTEEAMGKLRESVSAKKKAEFPETWSEEKIKKHKKAKRLGRSLAKDILLYNKEEVEKGKKEGNLVQVLGEEIKKSWKFYKKQVPQEVLQENNYFKEALNEIIADGKEVFK